MTHKKETPPGSGSRERLLSQLKERIIGQSDALEEIVPRVQMYKANLSPEGRPAGVFMLLGPTGTGKTETVQALAEVIHGSAKNVLRIDCGEYQMEHEVAKLIGAPPGYLGHRETQPALTQMKLNQVMSDKANLAIILFDEIEKAAPSLLRILLGVLDKGVLTLGDNTKVQFERTLIFFTSNLGAQEMARELGKGVGFSASFGEKSIDTVDLAKITKAAVKRKLSPELINRIDAFITYKPLTEDNVRQILNLQLHALAEHLRRRLGHTTFYLQVPKSSRDFLIENGYSREYGARELKRTIDKYLLEPLADLLTDGLVEPGAIITCGYTKGAARLNFSTGGDEKEVKIFSTGAGTLSCVFDKRDVI